MYDINTRLRAPFPWFGGKAPVADVVWERLGDVDIYFEPFLGSGAVLLARPEAHRWWERDEIVNDKDGFVCNFYRALQHDPEAVARYADWPLFESDLHARHAWLVEQREFLTAKLEGDPDYYDARIAGWWVWGVSSFIGEFATGRGPWRRRDGMLVRSTDDGPGIYRKHPQIVITPGVHKRSADIYAWFDALGKRLRHVRVLCGDWSRARRAASLPSLLTKGVVGVFLDPPYDIAQRTRDLYAVDEDIAHQVRAWAIENGDNENMRIALCGFEQEHEMPAGWDAVTWPSHGGLRNMSRERGKSHVKRECIWFSPHCLKARQPRLFAEDVL